jgi:hypothetical protein
MIQHNVNNGASSQTTKDYNSMCLFNGKVLGCNENGLFLQEGRTDNGTNIDARIDSGMFDLGMNNKKRFRFFYFGLEATGPIILSIYGDGVLAAEYAVENGKSGIQNIRVPISRETKARYWQWRIENVRGAFFALYSVEALPVFLAAGLGD